MHQAYDVLMAGGKPTSDAVSPGHSSLFSYDLPKGTYLLQCFVADDTAGTPHAFMGMHLVVRVHQREEATHGWLYARLGRDLRLWDI